MPDLCQSSCPTYVKLMPDLCQKVCQTYVRTDVKLMQYLCQMSCPTYVQYLPDLCQKVCQACVRIHVKPMPEFMPTLCQMGHEGLAITHYTFDRALLQALVIYLQEVPHVFGSTACRKQCQFLGVSCGGHHGYSAGLGGVQRLLQSRQPQCPALEYAPAVSGQRPLERRLCIHRITT